MKRCGFDHLSCLVCFDLSAAVTTELSRAVFVPGVWKAIGLNPEPCGVLNGSETIEIAEIRKRFSDVNVPIVFER